MQTMSLYESNDSSGDISLQDDRFYQLKKIIELVIHGGWLASIELPMKQAALLPKEYIEVVLNDDVYRTDGVKRDIHKMRLLLHSLARNESTTVTNKTLKNDIEDNDDKDIDVNTLAEYLNIFSRLFIIDNQKQAKFVHQSELNSRKKTFLRFLTRLCIIYGLSNAAYQRDDGIFIVPITALKD